MAIKKSPANNINLQGSIELSGDKSISIRVILLSAWAHGISTFYNLGNGDDVKTALSTIQKLGIKVVNNKSKFTVFGCGVGYDKIKNSINLNMGNSGTCTRLVTAQLASSAITSRLFGDKSLSKRPLRIINVLSEFGCNIQAYKRKFLPIKIYGNPDTIQSNISIKKSSAQIISSAIFCAMNSYGTSNIISKNDSRDHTEKLLKYLKYPINIKLKKTNKIKNISIIGKQKLEAINNYRIPSDPSSAAFLIVLSTLSENSNLTIRNVLINKFRIHFIDILLKMGAKIKISKKRNYFGEQIADINVKSSKLSGIKISPEIVPSIIDELPILFVAASFAKGESFFPNLSELKIKESDRLSAMYLNLKKCGVNCLINKNSLVIKGLSEKYFSNEITKIDTFGDHRIALSFLVFSSVSRKKIIINNFDTVNVSFPNIEKLIKKLYKKKNKIIVALDGTVSSGKTSICKNLVKKYKGKAFFFDSGLLYRKLSLIHLKKKSKRINVDFLAKSAKNIKLNDLRNPELHSNEVSKIVSKIAKIKSIRTALLQVQRNIIFKSKNKIVLVAGRDIGSKVLPNNFSDLKIFIDAPVHIRARRRFDELKAKFPHKNLDYKTVMRQLMLRDKVDSLRKISPLIKVKSAHLISNHSKYISTPVIKIMKLIKKTSLSN